MKTEQIGYTSSGKPIYENHSHPSHSGFTSKDHGDAAGAHLRAGDKLYAKQDDHKEALDHHDKQMKKHAVSQRYLEETRKKPVTPQVPIEESK